MSTDALLKYIDRHIEDFVDHLIQICEVPAPTFHEEQRGKLFASFFKGKYQPQTDTMGNVIIPIAQNGRPQIVLSAHLDTVFPFDQIKVQRNETMLRAPGISDDSAGLAALLLLARAFESVGQMNQGSLTLVATVGEEGLGNLRGARHFFQNLSGVVDYFISLDGCDAERLVTVGLASKRVRLFLRGPGGHSWGDAGLPNPIHACGELLSRFSKLDLPRTPKTTLNVGVISGGTSVNTIPTQVSMDVDLRSDSADSLLWLDQTVQSSLHEVESASPGITTELVVLGERPYGRIAEDHFLVKNAIQANRLFGLDAKTETGSTDSNIPFSLGIAAITMGVGGKSGKIHTPEEWFDYQDVGRGLKRTAVLIASLLESAEC
jgi:tripeptide aminopeptidase